MINLLKKIIIAPIRLYQVILSPMLGPKCRYQPTCSHYMIDAIQEWGIIHGLYLGIKRIFRCHPWADSGHDPVPKKNNKNA